MKTIASLMLLALPFAVQAQAGSDGGRVKETITCSGDAPYKYRIAFSYIGGRNSKDEVGNSSGFYCLEREVKREADWNWLQKKVEIEPRVTRITIMSAVPVAN
ncbi:hypothetical protein [Paraburkholderia sp. SIMBA_054]|uniref:hypothetical protein n=1 Tax=Paraburkholderia sp. SIMBA_054 TaxID=3085795 RepID=UPI00397E4A8E